MSNYFSNDNDLDNILEPRQPGDPAMANVLWAEGGVDLSDIYAPASVGSPAPNIFYRKNGSDIGPLFCANGTRRTADTRNIFSMANDQYTATEGSTNCTAIIAWNSGAVGGSGWAGAYVSGSSSPGHTGTPDFEWLQTGSAADYEIRLTKTSGDALGTFGVWESLGSGVFIQEYASASGGAESFKYSEGTYQIRIAATGAVLGEGNWETDAQVTYV